jgi:hypothetical protein
LSHDRQEITGLIAEVARSQSDTYDRAERVREYSFGAVGGEDWIYHPLWALWGVLTTWVEMEPDETDAAEATMREAAQAFLPITENDDALRLYFDQWLYEERGGFYARPEPPPKNPPFSRTKEGERRQEEARARQEWPGRVFRQDT